MKAVAVRVEEAASRRRPRQHLLLLLVVVVVLLVEVEEEVIFAILGLLLFLWRVSSVFLALPLVCLYLSVKVRNDVNEE